MKKFTLLTKILSFVLLSLFIAINPVISLADKLTDLQKQISDQTKQLQANENSLKYYSSQLNTVSTNIPQLDQKLNNIQDQIKAFNLQISIFNEEKSLSQLQMDEKKLQEDKSLQQIYVQWKLNDELDISLLNSNGYDLLKAHQFSSYIVGDQQSNVTALNSQIKNLNNQISGYDSNISDLNTQITSLTNQKSQLLAQQNYYNSQITAGNNNEGVIKTTVKTLQTEVSTYQQQALVNEFNSYNNSNQGGVVHVISNGGGATSSSVSSTSSTSSSTSSIPQASGSITQDSVSGNISFSITGRGNDYRQGNGVGLSQWGANGMGKAGMTYKEILAFYYKGSATSSGYENRIINLSGYGDINVEDYSAGQGEIPSHACGSQAQASSNPSKYTVYNGNPWSCWPEETIKAFVIAYRTYGVYHGSTCPTSACQVYNGSHNTQWAVDETRGVVATYNGLPLDALYGATNSQGYGTADNDTLFQGYGGYGSPYPYLRAVNDDKYDIVPGNYHNYSYKVGNFTVNDINNIINNAISNSGRYGNGFSNYLNSVESKIGGQIQSISFERDASLRVKRVWIKGVNGNSTTIGGWWFNDLVNIYEYDHSNRSWPLLSQTIFFANSI